jgi:hypothetical protein
MRQCNVVWAEFGEAGTPRGPDGGFRFRVSFLRGVAARARTVLVVLSGVVRLMVCERILEEHEMAWG